MSVITTVRTVNAINGNSIITATGAFPAGEALSAVGRIAIAFGTTNGLSSVKLGDSTEGDDIWAPSMGITLGTESETGEHTIATRLFSTGAKDVIITAVDGNFDATGQIVITTRTRDVTPQ